MHPIDDEFGHYIRHEEEITAKMRRKIDKNFKVDYLRDMSADEEMLSNTVLVILHNDHTVAIVDISKEYVLVTDIRYRARVMDSYSIILEYFDVDYKDVQFLCKDYQN
jgi:hypothetical protein